MVIFEAFVTFVAFGLFVPFVPKGTVCKFRVYVYVGPNLWNMEPTTEIMDHGQQTQIYTHFYDLAQVNLHSDGKSVIVLSEPSDPDEWYREKPGWATDKLRIAYEHLKGDEHPRIVRWVALSSTCLSYYIADVGQLDTTEPSKTGALCSRSYGPAHWENSTCLRIKTAL